MATLTDLETYTLALSAQIRELGAHVATIRQMLEGLGVSPAQYDAAHLPIAEQLRSEHADRLEQAVRAARDQVVQLQAMLATHKSPPQ